MNIAGGKSEQDRATVVANGHRGPVLILRRIAKWGPGNPRESATENTQPMASIHRGTGKVEMVR